MRREQFSVGQLIRKGASNGAVTVLEYDDSGLVTICKCATGAIPTAVAGYAVGCVLINTTTGGLYTNNSATSCTFSLTGTVTNGSVTATQLASNAVTTAKILDANVTPAKTLVTQAVTPTVGGLTTGIIADTTTFAAVTSGNAAYFVTLPTPTPGR